MTHLLSHSWLVTPMKLKLSVNVHVFKLSMDKRLILFLVGCMGSRVTLVWIAKNYPRALFYMGIMAVGISCGFMYIWVNGLRKTGIETLGEKIWWNDLRPLHSILWGIFAVMAFQGNQNAWKVLLLDVTIGFLAWLNHRMILVNFKVNI